MPALHTLVPEARSVLEMQTADLAGYLLEVLLSDGPTGGSIWNRRNFCMQASREYVNAGEPSNMSVGIACSSAWAWLEANGFICKHPEQDNDWYLATSRGQTLRTHQDLSTYMTSEQLPEALLHPEMLVNVRPLFFQSRFETAVFEAFKTLEVTIRSASRLGHDLVGVALASRAFHSEDGPLTDTTAERGERVALMNLMTGALGSYKNPASHRRVEISAEEARDMIILASHLLKIVQSRTPN